MSYTSVAEDSISEIQSWVPDENYVVVASSRQIQGDYVVFEPNYRFTRYELPIAISQSTDEKTFLYKLSLPCPFNPFIYFIFHDFEISALELIGNAETDSKVFIQRTFHPLDTNDCFSEIISETELLGITYNLSDDGELVINGINKPDTEFCEERYDAWVKMKYEPYFYHDDSSPQLQTSIVFRNAKTELDLIQLCHLYCSQTNLMGTIQSFIGELTTFFLKLFTNTNGQSELVRMMYKEYFRTLTPKETFNLIGRLVQNLKLGEVSTDKLWERQFLFRFDNEILISRSDPENKAIYAVKFYSKHLTISTTDGQLSNIVVYHNTDFEYGFILL